VSTGRTAQWPAPRPRTTTLCIFDAYGNPCVGQDVSRILSYVAWDPSDRSQDGQADLRCRFDPRPPPLAGKPSGWSTPSGGGLHLTTSLTPDDLGRTTKGVDPNGNVKLHRLQRSRPRSPSVRRSWNLNKPHDRRSNPSLARVRPVANASSGEQAVLWETLSTSATPTYNGSDEPTGAETIASANIPVAIAYFDERRRPSFRGGRLLLPRRRHSYDRDAAVIGTAIAATLSSGNYHPHPVRIRCSGPPKLDRLGDGNHHPKCLRRSGNEAAVGSVRTTPVRTRPRPRRVR